MILALACGPTIEDPMGDDGPGAQTSAETTGDPTPADTTTGPSTDPMPGSASNPGTSASTTGPACPSGNCDDDANDDCSTDDCRWDETETDTETDLTCGDLTCPGGQICVSWTEVEDTDGDTAYSVSCETIPDRCQELEDDELGACLIAGICQAQGYCAQRYRQTAPNLACFTDPGCF